MCYENNIAYNISCMHRHELQVQRIIFGRICVFLSNKMRAECDLSPKWSVWNASRTTVFCVCMRENVSYKFSYHMVKCHVSLKRANVNISMPFESHGTVTTIKHSRVWLNPFHRAVKCMSTNRKSIFVRCHITVSCSQFRGISAKVTL